MEKSGFWAIFGHFSSKTADCRSQSLAKPLSYFSHVTKYSLSKNKSCVGAVSRIYMEKSRFLVIFGHFSSKKADCKSQSSAKLLSYFSHVIKYVVKKKK